MPTHATLMPRPAKEATGDAPSPRPTTDEQHLRTLEEIRAQVGDMFQRDAEFCSRSPHRVLLLDWPLNRQLPGMARRSNKVAITFGPAWLDRFIASPPGRRVELLAEVRKAIRFRMREFEERRDSLIFDEGSVDPLQMSLR